MFKKKKMIYERFKYVNLAFVYNVLIDCTNSVDSVVDSIINNLNKELVRLEKEIEAYGD